MNHYLTALNEFNKLLLQYPSLNDQPIEIKNLIRFAQIQLDRLKPMDLTTSVFEINIDDVTYSAVQEVINSGLTRDGWRLYVHIALHQYMANNRFFKFPREQGEICPYIKAPFSEGPKLLRLRLHNPDIINSQAKMNGISASKYIRLALQDWASQPAGLSIYWDY